MCAIVLLSETLKHNSTMYIFAKLWVLIMVNLTSWLAIHHFTSNCSFTVIQTTWNLMNFQFIKYVQHIIYSNRCINQSSVCRFLSDKCDFHQFYWWLQLLWLRIRGFKLIFQNLFSIHNYFIALHYHCMVHPTASTNRSYQITNKKGMWQMQNCCTRIIRRIKIQNKLKSVSNVQYVVYMQYVKATYRSL